MYFQVVQLLPTLDPDTGELLLRFWQVENGQALVLIIAFVPITAIIGIYLRVVPPSLDDYAREVAQEKEKS